jgi:hypothetical protein
MTYQRNETPEPMMAGGQNAPEAGYAPRKFVRWGDCRCILTKYCDGHCNPIYVDRTEEEKAAWLADHSVDANNKGAAQHSGHSAPLVQDERERFENFIRTSRTSKGRKHVEKQLARMEGGDYLEDHTQRHWWTWQSALGLTRHAQDARNETETPAVPQWIDDPHDIEQGRMLNPEWLKLHGLTLAQVAAQPRANVPNLESLETGEGDATV